MSEEEKLLREALAVLTELYKKDGIWCRGDSVDLGAMWRLLHKLEAYYGG